MKRRITITALLLLTAASLQGQAVRGVQARSRPKKPKVPNLTEMTVPPAAAPEAALDYRLLPEPLDETPGNAALLYQMAQQLMLQNSKKSTDRWRAKLRDWQELPNEKLPAEEVRKMLEYYWRPLRQVELAARRETCDWGLPVRSEGINLLLSPLHQYRALAKVLLIQARMEIAQNKFDDALYTLQTGYAMGQHLAEGPTLIHALVGIAISSLMNGGVEEMMQAGGGPNLYWALAEMPRPTVSLRKALRYESSWLFYQAPLLRKVRKGKLTPEELHRLPAEFATVLQYVELAAGSTDQAGRRLMFTGLALKVYPQAKRRLVAKGYTEEQIKAMPVAQAVGMYSMARFMYWRDEMAKWSSLPYWQAHDGMQRTRAAFDKAMVKNSLAEGFPFTNLLPSLWRACFISTRLDRHVAALQTIEAVRMYVAKEGKLPAGLSDILDAPAPIDPMTGKPFEYKVDGRSFTLTCPAPSGIRPEDGAVFKVTVEE